MQAAIMLEIFALAGHCGGDCAGRGGGGGDEGGCWRCMVVAAVVVAAVVLAVGSAEMKARPGGMGDLGLRP